MLSSLILIVGNSCAVKYAPHDIETCIHNSDYSAECNDLRLSKDKQSYTRTNLENYICTNAKDEQYLINYADDLRKKLIKCEGH